MENIEAQQHPVTSDKIREFARAIGAAAAIHHDAESARAGGYSAVVAPATFGITVLGPRLEALLAGSELDPEHSIVLHTAQRFEYHRPMCAGEAVTSEVEIDGHRSRGADTMIDIACRVLSSEREPILSMRTSLIVRGHVPLEG